MMLNCQENSSIQTAGSVMSLTPYQLRTWWQSLSLEEKETICMLDAPHVTSDLANVANNALVVCKLNHTYKKKDLISWTKFKDDDGAVLSQTFEFNLKGKDLLDNSLAELFSSFYISIARDHKQQPGTYPSHEGNLPTQTQQKSLIGVKREKLDFILDLLSYAIPNFGEGQKFLFQKKDFLELYSFFITNPFQQVPAFVALPPHIQTLFDRLSVVSSLMEYQINLAYYEGVIARPSKLVSPVMSDQLNNLSTIISDFEAMKNTGLPVPEPSGDQNSTASGSPGNPVVLNISQQNINIEELSEKLLQKTVKDNSTCSIARVQEELMNQSNPSIYFGNEEQDEMVFMYEGCLVGDLQILFDPVDAFLSYEEKEVAQESKEGVDWVERGFDDLEDGVVLEGEQLNNEKYEEEKSLSEGDMFYNNMNYGQAYPQQGYYNNNTDYYNQYYPQQFNNYGASNMYPDYNQQQMNYPVNYGYYNGMQAPGKNSYEYQSSFAGDRDYYQAQSYGEYSHNNYNPQPSEMISNGEKPQYKDRSRYEPRPKLPPRFQRMKNNVFRS